MHIFYITGNVGSGKTSLLRLLKKKYAKFAKFIDSVCDNDHVDCNTSLSDRFLSDPKRWALARTISNITKYLNIQMNLSSCAATVIFVDGSIHQELIYASALHSMGILDDVELKIVNCLGQAIENQDQDQDHISTSTIHCGADANTCFARLLEREHSELTLNFNYLAEIETQFEKSKTRCINIDTNADFRDCPIMQSLLIDSIEKIFPFLSDATRDESAWTTVRNRSSRFKRKPKTTLFRNLH